MMTFQLTWHNSRSLWHKCVCCIFTRLYIDILQEMLLSLMLLCGKFFKVYVCQKLLKYSLVWKSYGKNKTVQFFCPTVYNQTVIIWKKVKKVRLSQYVLSQLQWRTYAAIHSGSWSWVSSISQMVDYTSISMSTSSALCLPVQTVSTELVTRRCLMCDYAHVINFRIIIWWLPQTEKHDEHTSCDESTL